MKVSQLGWIVTAVIFATMVGCGSNGDPGKKYDGVKSTATVKTEPGVPSAVPESAAPVVQPAPPPPLNCNTPVTLSVEKKKPNEPLTFAENTETTYNITVRSNVGADFKIDIANQDPDLASDLNAGRAKLASLGVSGANAKYAFTWKPGKLSSGQKSILPLAFAYSSGAGAICEIKETENLYLVVQAQSAKTAGDAK